MRRLSVNHVYKKRLYDNRGFKNFVLRQGVKKFSADFLFSACASWTLVCWQHFFLSGCLMGIRERPLAKKNWTLFVFWRVWSSDITKTGKRRIHRSTAMKTAKESSKRQGTLLEERDSHSVQRILALLRHHKINSLTDSRKEKSHM